MRMYNKWYKELWWWLQENKDSLGSWICVALGLLLVYMCIYSLIYFNRGGK
jgi:hypothetical protein